jgi:hypothetical protein
MRCTTGKSPLTTEPGKGDQVLWCSKARPAISSRKCLAVSTRDKVSPFQHFIVVKVCGDSEATFDFAKVSLRH